jgi:hypothetical protein
MNILENINKILPSIESFLPRTEVEYYGFASYLMKKLSLNALPESTSSLRHGWMHEDFKYPEEITMGIPQSKYLVGTEREVEFLNNKQIFNVKAVGVPFIYIDEEELSHIHRYKNSLLVMPPHSLPESSHEWKEEEYVSQILKLKNDFSEIVFCIHQSCLKKKLWISVLKKHSIPWIIGADALDNNSLMRMAKIFRSFEYVTTNAFGSHIAYAAYSGCKVSIYGTFFEFQKKDFQNVELYKIFPFLLDHIVKIFSQGYIKERYEDLFVHPTKAKKRLKWSKKALGYEYKVSYKQLAEELGWIYNDELINSKISNLTLSYYFRTFYTQVDELNKKSGVYVIYGAGTIGKMIRAILKQYVFFVDISSLESTDLPIEGKVYNPDVLKKLEFDYIIISVFGMEEGIKKYLKSIGIPDEKFIFFNAE